MLPSWVLPGALLLAPDVADPRRPADQVTLQTAGVDVALGSQIALLGSDGDVAWRFGLLGGSWVGFEPGGTLTFHLMTFDGRFGVPLDLQRGPLVLRLMWAHDSAHRGDGVRAVPGAWPEGVGWQPHSREWVEARMSWTGRIVGGLQGSAQAGTRQLTHSTDGGSGTRLDVSMGVQGEGVGFSPYAAAHVHGAAEQDWAPAMAGEVGLALGGSLALRLALVAHRGPDAAGQLAGRDDDWVGFRFEVSP